MKSYTLIIEALSAGHDDPVLGGAAVFDGGVGVDAVLFEALNKYRGMLVALVDAPEGFEPDRLVVCVEGPEWTVKELMPWGDVPPLRGDVALMVQRVWVSAVSA